MEHSYFINYWFVIILICHCYLQLVYIFSLIYKTDYHRFYVAKIMNEDWLNEMVKLIYGEIDYDHWTVVRTLTANTKFNKRIVMWGSLNADIQKYRTVHEHKLSPLQIKFFKCWTSPVSYIKSKARLHVKSF